MNPNLPVYDFSAPPLTLNELYPHTPTLQDNILFCTLTTPKLQASTAALLCSYYDRIPELDLADGDDSASVDSLPSPATPERVCTITPRRRVLIKRKLEYEEPSKGKLIRLGCGTGFSEVYEGGRLFVTRRAM
jgi:hypothetical protein